MAIRVMGLVMVFKGLFMVNAHGIFMLVSGLEKIISVANKVSLKQSGLSMFYIGCLNVSYIGISAAEVRGGSFNSK